MFEEQYRKAFDQALPSEELQQETLALLQEAQDHHIQPEQPVRKWKLAYTVSLAGTAAAILICVVSASFWMDRGQKYDEIEGEWTTNDSLFSENEAFCSDDPAENTVEDSAASLHQDENKTASGSDEDSDQAEDSELKSDNEENKSDNNAPVIVNNGETKTYLSLADFVEELEAMSAPGFGTNYLYSKELLIIPSLTYEEARFRCLYLDIASGNYSYSYLITSEGVQYYLEIRTELTLPKTADALSKILENISANITFRKEENGYRYSFEEQGEVTVRVYPTDGTAIPDEETADQILKTHFSLHRYDPDNPCLNMTY
ncbi:MAG: hypothetical protein IJ407_02690 [Clostridia bacterium]|nr:hypothetical protein [Clostridia bacterium]